MKTKRRWLIWLLTLVLCLGAALPLPVSAADLYFTSVNDTVLPLTADTMPVWSGNVLYVPYTVFDSATNGGIKLGIDTVSYSRTENTVTLYNTRQFLRFDLNDGTCRDDLTGEAFNAKAIIRNNRPYLPVKTVCFFFGLTYSYNTISQGYLVRIKSDAVVLSDARFIEAAGNTINLRLRAYNQSLNPTPSTSPSVTPSTPSTPAVPSDNSGSATDVRTYLAFRCTEDDSAGETAAILDALDSSGVYALFLFTPQALRQESDVIRRILGTGHSIGLLAEGADLSQTRALLEEGNRLLEQTVHIRTTLAYVPQDQRSTLDEDGWICWNETLLLTASETTGANTFAANTLRRLAGRAKTTYLTLEGNENTVRVLSTLLRQLKSSHFIISIPMETQI